MSWAFKTNLFGGSSDSASWAYSTSSSNNSSSWAYATSSNDSGSWAFSPVGKSCQASNSHFSSCDAWGHRPLHYEYPSHFSVVERRYNWGNEPIANWGYETSRRSTSVTHSPSTSKSSFAFDTSTGWGKLKRW